MVAPINRNEKSKQNSKKWNEKILFVLLIIFIFLFLFIKFKGIIFYILIILFSTITMQHKRFIAKVLGIDFCLFISLLSGSNFGAKPGAIVGLFSYLFGMMTSFEIAKAPRTALFGSILFATLGLIGSLFSSHQIINFGIVWIIVVNIVSFFGLKLLGNPTHFLFRYTLTNALGNFIFLQTFGPLLKTIF